MTANNGDKKRLEQLLKLYYEGNTDESMLQELVLLVHDATDQDMIPALRELWEVACETPQDTAFLNSEQSDRIFNSIVSFDGQRTIQSGQKEARKNEVTTQEDLNAKDTENDQQTLPYIRNTPRTRIILQRLMMAAIIISVLLGAYYLFVPSKPSSSTVTQNGSNAEINPGTEGAVLILADGSQIVIDSNDNGAIAKQGSVTITKKANQINYSGNSSEQVLNTMRTPKGRKFSLQLEDGSRVWLNASSSITFPVAFTGDERNVSIQGEVYFEIAQNKQKPFRVRVSDSSVIEVLGTHFNIQSYQDESSVLTTLIEGSVKVIKGSKTVKLNPGQQAAASGTDLQINSHANIDHVMAWKNGYFSFQNADIKAVFRQVSRWYDIEIIYDDNLPDVLFSGEIGQNLSLSQVLSILDDTRIQYKLEGRKLRISN